MISQGKIVVVVDDVVRILGDVNGSRSRGRSKMVEVEMMERMMMRMTLMRRSEELDVKLDGRR